MIWILLSIVASILKWILTPFAYTYGCIESYLKDEFDDYNEIIAIQKDKYGNVVCKYLFNRILIKTNGYKFGNPLDTVSKVLGMNKNYETLTKLGRTICYILDKIQKNHVENAAKN
jgi:hypothetical protein